MEEFSVRSEDPAMNTSTSVSPASSTDELPPPSDVILAIEPISVEEEPAPGSFF